jgi:hypothetical protein
MAFRAQAGEERRGGDVRCGLVLSWLGVGLVVIRSVSRSLEYARTLEGQTDSPSPHREMRQPGRK